MRYLILLLAFVLIQCTTTEQVDSSSLSLASAKSQFSTTIDFDNPANYANQSKPAYITKDNVGGNGIIDKQATLGRILFYDKNLSIDNSISCGSCHKQAIAFGDTAIQSLGVSNGKTIRHSMRLINARFANESKFFWNERANNLETQTTMPIQDHLEMGFSGESGRGNLNTLLAKLQAIPYYPELFTWAYGDNRVTETRMQSALAQFIRSIQSFDSKYDAGRAQVQNDQASFPNFTALENQGKTLFLTPPVFNANSERVGGGFGCQGCHQAPEFDIDPNSRNNGIIGVIGSTDLDVGVTRAPSLRDVVNEQGNVNGPLMHTGAVRGLNNMLGHYNDINAPARNTNLDPRLRPNNIGQKLQMTPNEITAIVQFLRALSGKNVYVDKKWSDPFVK
ncbi:MAG: cytochrome-c peroxidase [Cytophagaceae bacterium]|nr:cytochrome-c peroxidase [Cytophagaceae bacterium]MBP6094300.1 cytochrome-c peroxidase [Cytophagaceae bacterium]